MDPILAAVSEDLRKRGYPSKLWVLVKQYPDGTVQTALQGRHRVKPNMVVFNDEYIHIHGNLKGRLVVTHKDGKFHIGLERRDYLHSTYTWSVIYPLNKTFYITDPNSLTDLARTLFKISQTTRFNRFWRRWKKLCWRISRCFRLPSILSKKPAS